MGRGEAIGAKETDAEIVHAGMIYVSIYVSYLLLACEPVVPALCQSNWVWVSMDEDTDIW